MISLPDHIPDLRRLNGFRAVIVLLLSRDRAAAVVLAAGQGNAELAEIVADAERETSPPGRAARRDYGFQRAKFWRPSRAKYVVSLSPDDAKKHPETF